MSVSPAVVLSLLSGFSPTCLLCCGHCDLLAFAQVVPSAFSAPVFAPMHHSSPSLQETVMAASGPALAPHSWGEMGLKGHKSRLVAARMLVGATAVTW